MLAVGGLCLLSPNVLADIAGFVILIGFVLLGIKSRAGSSADPAEKGFKI